MLKVIKVAIFFGLGALAACAGMLRTPPNPGDSIESVIAKMGPPTASWDLPAGRELEYATGPFGQATWMAHFGPDGRLTAFEQVLTGEKFATIKVGSATKEDVLRTIGHPAEHSYLPLRDFEVWSYRYKESGVWNSMMHVHFDRAGVVRMMQNGPDRMYEEKRFGGF